MPVVSNTSPVLNLAIIGRLPLLQQQFGEIWLPPVVLEGHLPSVCETIEQLRIEAGFRIGMELLNDILRESGEL